MRQKATINTNTMIKNIIALSVIFTIISCKKEVKKVDGYSINATISNVEDGKTASIFKMENRSRVILETDTIKNGKIEFSGKIDTPDSYYMTIDGVKGSLPFILENTTMAITIYKDSLSKSIITGSIENDLNKDYLQHSNKLRAAGKELQLKYKDAQTNNDSNTLVSVRRSYDSLRKIGKEYDINFVENNSNRVIGAITLQRLVSSRSLTSEEAEKYYNTLNDTIKASTAAKAIKAQVQSQKTTAIGSVAPNFTGKTTDGKDLSLNDIKSKVTIIDFWASWCGPCRKENPNVVKLYNKYHKKGLEIIGVSLDKQGQKQRWVDAIKKDKLAWPQISNLKGWNEPVAKLYNVRSIPRTFILDENGKIIAKNLRGDYLEKKIAEILD